jgi:single-strand DNA-binding protein
MASDLNNTLLQGRLTADPEFKATRNDNLVAKFRIASNHYVPSPQHTQENPDYRKFTTFISVDAWNRLAAKCDELRKGDRVQIVGKLKQENWIGENGEPRSRILISAETINTL